MVILNISKRRRITTEGRPGGKVPRNIMQSLPLNELKCNAYNRQFYINGFQQHIRRFYFILRLYKIRVWTVSNILYNKFHMPATQNDVISMYEEFLAESLDYSQPFINKKLSRNELKRILESKILRRLDFESLFLLSRDRPSCRELLEHEFFSS